MRWPWGPPALLPSFHWLNSWSSLNYYNFQMHWIFLLLLFLVSNFISLLSELCGQYKSISYFLRISLCFKKMSSFRNIPFVSKKIPYAVIINSKVVSQSILWILLTVSISILSSNFTYFSLYRYVKTSHCNWHLLVSACSFVSFLIVVLIVFP